MQRNRTEWQVHHHPAHCAMESAILIRKNSLPYSLIGATRAQGSQRSQEEGKAQADKQSWTVVAGDDVRSKWFSKSLNNNAIRIRTKAPAHVVAVAATRVAATLQTWFRRQRSIRRKLALAGAHAARSG